MKYIVGVVSLLLLTLAGHPLLGETKAAHQTVHWLDDLGESLPSEEVFEVCWIRGLDHDCSQMAGRSLPKKLPSFEVLQVESAGYGPLSVNAHDLLHTNHEYRLQVPRKAWLKIENLPGESPVHLSLYPQQNPAIARPVLRLGPLDQEVLRIPADAFLASLSSKGSAPHLTLLELGPGDRHTIQYQKRSGWSLVLRALDQQAGSPVARTLVEIAGAAGYSEALDTRVLEADTGNFGLVVFSGLEDPIVEANLHHPTFLRAQVTGLSSTRGTFAFHDVLLQRGGNAEVSIVFEGRPVSGTECSFLKYHRDLPGSQAPPKEVLSTRSDEEGLCKARNLREGIYWLRIRPPRLLVENPTSKSAHIDCVLQILEGQISRKEVLLEPTRLEGTVRLGKNPGRSYDVVVYDPTSKITNASSKDAIVVAHTDDEGHYEATLWTAGQYSVLVQNQSGTPGAYRKIRVDGGTTTLDFELAPREIAGRVIDGEGMPLERASVQLKWRGFSFRLAVTDANGDFAFPVENDGQVELIAHKDGYQSSDALQLEVGPDLEIEPLVLTLARRPETRIRLLTANGNPVLDGWAASYALEVLEPTWVGTAQAGPDGIFQLPVIPRQAHLLYFGGSNCPLGVRSIQPSSEQSTPVEILCAPAPGNLQITLTTSEGIPREGLAVLLAKGKVIYPAEVVAAHLARLGLPASTSGSGRLNLVALEPGEYRLYLASVTSPFNVLVGVPDGFLTTATLEPWSTRAAEVRLDLESPN